MKYKPVDYFYFNITQEMETRRKADGSIESFDLLYWTEMDDVMYFFLRVTTRKILMMKGKEIMSIRAFKKKRDGNYMEVYKSVDHPDFPICDKYDRIEILRGGIVYVPSVDVESGECVTSVSNYYYMNPQVGVSLTFVKGFISAYFKKVFRISWNSLNEFLVNGERNGETFDMNYWKQMLNLKMGKGKGLADSEENCSLTTDTME